MSLRRVVSVQQPEAQVEAKAEPVVCESEESHPVSEDVPAAQVQLSARDELLALCHDLDEHLVHLALDVLKPRHAAHKK